MKSAKSGVVGVVGKVGLALLGGTAGGVAKDRGINFLPDICGVDMLRVVEVVVLVRVCEVVECGVEVKDELWAATRGWVECTGVVSRLQVYEKGLCESLGEVG